MSAVPICTTCRVATATVATLGEGESYPGTFTGWPSSIVVDRGGNYLVVEPGAARVGGPWVFDPRGRFVRVIGRPGAGPGEFRIPAFLLKGPGDSLHVYDVGLRRVSVLSPNGTYVRSVPWQLIAGGGVVLGDGRYVVNGSFSDPERVGRPLHFLGPDGAYIRPFAMSEAVAPARASWSRFVVRSTDGSFWSVTRDYRYLIEHWDAEGKRLKVFAPARPWFQPFTSARGPTRDLPPTPTVTAVWFDDRENLLWVVVRVPDERWREGLGEEVTSPEGAKSVEVLDAARVFDGMVEVYDLRREALLTSQRLDEPYWLAFGASLSARFRQTPTGAHLIDITRFTLSR